MNAPTDGYFAETVTGAAALEGGPFYLAPEERCVLVPLIETLGSAGAEYNGTVLSLQVLQRARVSEIIRGKNGIAISAIRRISPTGRKQGRS